jgi:hypothetical protein
LLLFRYPKLIANVPVETICSGSKVDALLVTDTDPAWAMPDSWVWSRQPSFSDNHVRVFTCGQTPLVISKVSQ